MDAFKAAQEIWRARQREELEEENRKIQEYLQRISKQQKAE